MTNLSPTIQKIVKQAEKDFPWISDTLIIWIIDKLQDVEWETRQQALEELSKKSYVRNAKPADDYERGYDHGYDDKTVELQEKLSHLKSGEENTE